MPIANKSRVRPQIASGTPGQIFSESVELRDNGPYMISIHYLGGGEFSGRDRSREVSRRILTSVKLINICALPLQSNAKMDYSSHLASHEINTFAKSASRAAIWHSRFHYTQGITLVISIMRGQAEVARYRLWNGNDFADKSPNEHRRQYSEKAHIMSAR